MKVRLFLLALFILMSKFTFGQALTKEEIYLKYINCQLNYFWNNDFDDPLFIGLKSIINGDYHRAEKILLELIPTVSDSLKINFYNDLAYINYTQKNWSKGNEYVILGDSDFDQNAIPFVHFPNYAKEYVKLKSDTGCVDFIDNFYIKGIINGNKGEEYIMFDTGLSPSLISMSLAQKYNLKIDSTQYRYNDKRISAKAKKVSSTVINQLINSQIMYCNMH